MVGIDNLVDIHTGIYCTSIYNVHVLYIDKVGYMHQYHLQCMVVHVCSG